MALFGSATEYALHSILFLINEDKTHYSARELAEFQGISPSYVAKLFTKLEKAGLVSASEGIAGGYCLAKPPTSITLLDVIDAVEGPKPLFSCKNIRKNCTLFNDEPPNWATRGLCTIHASMLQAEQAMRRSLATKTIADLAQELGGKIPNKFFEQSQDWFAQRQIGRTPSKPSK